LGQHADRIALDKTASPTGGSDGFSIARGSVSKLTVTVDWQDSQAVFSKRAVGLFHRRTGNGPALDPRNVFGAFVARKCPK